MPPASTVRDSFPKTRWSIITSTGAAVSILRNEAVEKLCQIYWPPLYGFARMKGKSREDAEDLIQGYFCKLLKNNSLGNADRELGKFRTFLLKGFQNYMHDEWRRGQALRRGGGTNVEFSIDSGEGEKALALPDATTLTPEEVFDRNWANILLKQTLVRLREKFEKKGRIADYEAMLPFLAVSTEPSYAETAKEMGRSIESTRVYVQRFRAAYQQCIRAELADTLADGADLEEELRSLLEAFSRS